MKRIVSYIKIFMLCMLMANIVCHPTFAIDKTASETENKDPLERINRFFFSFNYIMDQLVLRSVAKCYKYIMPKFIQNGVTNIYNNFGEFRNILNFGLQLDTENMLNSSKRLIINSTLGIFGFIDVANHLGYKYHYNDFSKTIYKITGREGIYLELPFLGSKTVIDMFGGVADLAVNPVFYIDRYNKYWISTPLNAVQRRAKFVGIDSLVYGDKYRVKRDIYLEQRSLFLNPNKVIEDDF